VARTLLTIPVIDGSERLHAVCSDLAGQRLYIPPTFPPIAWSKSLPLVCKIVSQ